MSVTIGELSRLLGLKAACAMYVNSVALLTMLTSLREWHTFWSQPIATCRYLLDKVI